MLDSNWTTGDLWFASLGVGGNFSPSDVRSIVAGEIQPTRHQYDALAATLNDRDRAGHVPYWVELDDTPSS